MYSIKIFTDTDNLSKSVCDLIVDRAKKAIEKYGIFSMALSGGSSPVPIYRMLSSPQYSTNIDWSKTHLFWGDERCVPARHPANNYYCAYSNLISRIHIPESNIHRAPVELNDPEKVAMTYEHELKKFFKYKMDKSESSLFDLILLGMGKDGHTASIFPDREVIAGSNRWVVPSVAPEGVEPKHRITFTFSLINRSVLGLIIVIGQDKRKILKETLNALKKHKYPVCQINTIEKPLLFVDFEV